MHSLNKPFIAVNHLEGHAIESKTKLRLKISQLSIITYLIGHSQYLNVKGLGNYQRIGTTIDDALGEAFDKIAKLLGVEFPGVLK